MSGRDPSDKKVTNCSTPSTLLHTVGVDKYERWKIDHTPCVNELNGSFYGRYCLFSWWWCWWWWLKVCVLSVPTGWISRHIVMATSSPTFVSHIYGDTRWRLKTLTCFALYFSHPAFFVFLLFFFYKETITFHFSSPLDKVKKNTWIHRQVSFPSSPVPPGVYMPYFFFSPRRRFVQGIAHLGQTI